MCGRRGLVRRRALVCVGGKIERRGDVFVCWCRLRGGALLLGKGIEKRGSWVCWRVDEMWGS